MSVVLHQFLPSQIDCELQQHGFCESISIPELPSSPRPTQTQPPTNSVSVFTVSNANGISWKREDYLTLVFCNLHISLLPLLALTTSTLISCSSETKTSTSWWWSESSFKCMLWHTCSCNTSSITLCMESIALTNAWRHRVVLSEMESGLFRSSQDIARTGITEAHVSINGAHVTGAKSIDACHLREELRAEFLL